MPNQVVPASLMKAVLVFAGISLVLSLGMVVTAEQATGPAQPKSMSFETRTVYIKGHSGKDIEEQANRTHAASAPTGWVFRDMAIHDENNDIEGAWITYVREVETGPQR